MFCENSITVFNLMNLVCVCVFVSVRAVAASRNAVKACSSASSQSVGHSSNSKVCLPAV